jgi:Fic family protein
VLQLQKETEIQIQGLGSRAANAQKVCNYLYQHPIINTEKVAEVTYTSMPSAYKLIADLERMEILHEITGGQRGRMYRFDSYLDLFR